MRNAHSGFSGNSGVQSHSAGDTFPITIQCVGGFPRTEDDPNRAYCLYGKFRFGPYATYRAAEAAAEALKEFHDDGTLTDDFCQAVVDTLASASGDA